MGVGVRVPGPTLGRGQGWLPSAGHRVSVCETGPLFAQTPLPRPLLSVTRAHPTLTGLVDDKPAGEITSTHEGHCPV